MTKTRALRWAALAACLGAATMAAANETDQYLLPVDRPMADVGDFLDQVHYEVLSGVVDRLNREIGQVVRSTPDPEAREKKIASVASPRRVADLVRNSFKPGFFETLEIESVLRSPWAREAYGGDITIHHSSDWIYRDAFFPLDPRALPHQLPSSTIHAYGAYFGTDKLGHFHDLGHMYYKTWLNYLASGVPPEKALAQTVAKWTTGPVSEGGIIGIVSTGVGSNADMASNYSGMKFYMNLLEPTQLKGEEAPPLIVRRGDYFALNSHVRPESGFFGAFVSDHWNEALNPNIYEAGVRAEVRRRVEAEGSRVLEFYCRLDGRPMDPRYFEGLARELSTYYGEPYGHSGGFDLMVNIGGLCGGIDGPELETASRR